MPGASLGVPKPRKPRPSRARGLRTTTGCLTCRKRRVKCDEARPKCAICSKAARECQYASATAHSEDPNNGQGSATDPAPLKRVHVSRRSSSSNISKHTDSGDLITSPFAASPGLYYDSPLTNITSMPSPNSAPAEWYDLLAEDAINNIDKYNLNLDLDRTCLSRKQSPVPKLDNIDPQLQSPGQGDAIEAWQEQWNSLKKIFITNNELVLFQHYLNAVAPMLDLCNASTQFTTVVPMLAIHNVGLLKSLLAVAARHMALMNEEQIQPDLSAQPTGMPDGNSKPLQTSFVQIATQYYYETLHYLSQNLLYPSYSKSQEIIATALLISTYEMYASGRHSNSAWERHLRGIFCIQRAQNNNGECKDPLRRAAWWSWLRQDTWVAFRENRRVLTIWRPLKRLMDLSPDELCLRIVYITSRCVDFAANDKKYDINTRIDQSQKLLQALDDWHKALPSSFQPIYKPDLPKLGDIFTPIWIHPPSHAAAIQTFHFGRSIVLMNQPSVGGMGDFRLRQCSLDDSVHTICGIAMMHQGDHLPSAFVDFQALYVAGLCVQNPAKQAAILQLLDKTLDVTKFPPKTLLDDLEKYWRGETNIEARC